MIRSCLILSIFCLSVLQSSCQQEKEGTTKFGYSYINYTNNKGDKPQVGDMVYYHVQHRNGDQVTFASRHGRSTPNQMMIPDYSTLPSPKPSPILDVLREMSLNDSATVFLPLEEGMLHPKGYEDADAIAYDVVLLGIDKADDLIKKNLEGQLEGMEIQEVTTITSSIQKKDTSNRPPLTDEEKKQMINEMTTARITQAMDILIDKYNEGVLLEKIKTTPSGLKYYLLEQGDGAKPQNGNTVEFHVHGCLTDKKNFVSTFKTGDEIMLKLGSNETIPGLEEGIKLMKENGNIMLFVPPVLGYGKKGEPKLGVPPDTELVYYISLVSVR